MKTRVSNAAVVLLLCFSLLLSLSSNALSKPKDNGSQLSITCKVLNPDTLQEQNTFRPGDKVMLDLDVVVPPEAEGKKVNITAKLSLQVPSLGANVNLSSLKIMGFNRDPGLGNPDIDERLPFSGEFSKSIVFSIPEYTPPCVGTVKVTAKIKKAGKKTCTARIEVLPKESEK